MSEYSWADGVRFSPTTLARGKTCIGSYDPMRVVNADWADDTDQRGYELLVVVGWLKTVEPQSGAEIRRDEECIGEIFGLSTVENIHWAGGGSEMEQGGRTERAYY